MQASKRPSDLAKAQVGLGPLASRTWTWTRKSGSDMGKPVRWLVVGVCDKRGRNGEAAALEDAAALRRELHRMRGVEKREDCSGSHDVSYPKRCLSAVQLR